MIKMITPEKFKLDMATLESVQQTRKQLGNRIYNFTVNTLLHEHPKFNELQDLRRAKDSDRKAIAKLIKKMIVDMGKTEEALLALYKENLKSNINYRQFHFMEKGNKRSIPPIIGIEEIVTENLTELYPKSVINWFKAAGLGVLTTAKLLSTIGEPTRFQHQSDLNHYFGVYTENGKAATIHANTKASFNPLLKSFALYGLGQNILIKKKNPYRRIYDEEVKRQRTLHPEMVKPDGGWLTVSKDQRHPCQIYYRARRKTVQRFLSDVLVMLYMSKGLEPPKPYICVKEPELHHLEPMVVPYISNGKVYLPQGAKAYTPSATRIKELEDEAESISKP